MFIRSAKYYRQPELLRITTHQESEILTKIHEDIMRNRNGNPNKQIIYSSQDPDSHIWFSKIIAAQPLLIDLGFIISHEKYLMSDFQVEYFIISWDLPLVEKIKIFLQEIGCKVRTIEHSKTHQELIIYW